MALSDSSEYWQPIYRKTHEKRNKYPPHECIPRDVPDGTPFKWFCVICHRKINAKNWKIKHDFS